MMKHTSAKSLSRFFDTHDTIVLVELTRVRGSSPRELGTAMYVSEGGMWGTIGGGQLEYMAIDHARGMLKNDVSDSHLDVPLGPEIGQCCGGRVEISFSMMQQKEKGEALEVARQHDAEQPHVYVMGAGHTGRALADLFQHLPVRCILVDSREIEIDQIEAEVETRLCAVPEAEIESAPAGSAVIVLTHDHAQDFLITKTALERTDCAYVGMIGSATKRSKFESWMQQEDTQTTTDNLICPIGATGSSDKRPSIIAAFVAAEVMAALTSSSAAEARDRAKRVPASGDPTDLNKALAK